jgi:hypothetical protein
MSRWFDRRICAALAIAALISVWPVWRAKAFNPQPDPPAFGLIGVDPFQTARLNVVCADTPLPGGVNPGPCDVTLAFRDMSGRVLTMMAVSLRPGEGRSLDFRGMLSATAGRMEVQPFIAPTGRGFVLATVELFENLTGRTAAALNPTEPRSLGSSGPVGQ